MADLIPPVQQRSVDELIERNIVLHQRGMDEIWLRFRNTVIVKALQICDGNASHAAIMLKIHRNTLGRWMRQANIVRGNGGVE